MVSCSLTTSRCLWSLETRILSRYLSSLMMKSDGGYPFLVWSDVFDILFVWSNFQKIRQNCRWNNVHQGAHQGAHLTCIVESSDSLCLWCYHQGAHQGAHFAYIVVESGDSCVSGTTTRGPTRGPTLNGSYIGLDCFVSWETLFVCACFWAQMSRGDGFFREAPFSWVFQQT